MSTPPGALQPKASLFTLDEVMAQAALLQGQGRLQEAEHLLRQILQQQPAHPFALHLLGVIAYQVGRLPLAAELVQQAILQKADVALFHANLGEITRRLHRLDVAIAHGEQAVRLDPRLVMAHANLGIAYFDRKDYARAEQSQQRALALAPNFAPALNNMGCIQRDLKRSEAAVRWFRQAIAADPRYLEPLSNLGALLLERDEVGEAQAVLEAALHLHPEYPEAICNMGGVHLAREDHMAALGCFQRALGLRPAYVEALLGLARARQAMDSLNEAEATALQALHHDEARADTHALLGSIYTALEQTGAARQHFERALALDPACDAALVGLGYLCMEAGEMEPAEACFQRAVVARPGHLSAHIHITQVRKVRAGDASLNALLEHWQSIDALGPERAIALEFALGKALDDIRDYEQAFVHFSAGCQRKRQRLDYDPEQTAGLFRELKAIFSRDAVDRWRGGGNASHAPIFVLGMPRSGTTLTEQIIASHPRVYGRGELDDLLRIAERPRLVAGQSLGFPGNLRDLEPAGLALWADEYLAGTRRHPPGTDRVTDKMPANFFVLGLIHLMLPNARIIHVQRDPVDNCLSCFTNLFRSRQEYSYDLAELGRYYVDYWRLMEHWRQVLPAGAFLDIRYEDLVARPEESARRLIDYCGLEWNPACLDFHHNKRVIRTASITQVRQPIYGSSVQRWRSYEKFLAPLLDALGDLVPDYQPVP